MKATPEGGTVAQRLIANPYLLGVTLVLVLVAGLSALAGLPRIEDPRITSRNALVLTALPGATAQRVEALVTEPIEVELRELSEVKTVESTSRPGISLVSVELEDDITRDTNEAAFSRIRDALDQVAPRLPSEASTPELDDERGAVAFSLIVAVAADGGSPGSATDGSLGEPLQGLGSRLARELADRLRDLPGTELVRLYGDAEEIIDVTLDRQRSASLGLTPAQVGALLREADARNPAGALHGDSRDITIEVQGAFDSTRRVGEVPVLRNASGSVVRVADVARVEKSIRTPVRQVALADGRRVVLVAARVQEGVRLDRWADRAQEVVDRFAERAGQGISVDVTYDQSRYTDGRLALLTRNLLGGAGVVMLVVLAGLGLRAALIVGAALPLSAAATLFGLSVAGQSIHQMSIFGMIIAVGLLIDSAIVVADRVASNLRAGLAPSAAAGKAIRHLRVPLLASTVTTVLGFMPVFLLPGNVGDFVSPIAVSVILALLASLAISLTLVAALGAHLLPRTPERGSRLRRWIANGWSSEGVGDVYRRALRASLARPLRSIAVALVLPVAGFAAASTLEMEFFPSADRDQFEVEIRLDGAPSIQRTAALARAVEETLREDPAIERVDWLVGASYPSVYYNLLMDQDDDPGYAHAIVTARSAADAARLLMPVQATLDRRFPGAQSVVSAFGQGPPTEAPVEFRIVGPEPARLAQAGQALRRLLHEHPQVVHTRATLDHAHRKILFRVDEDSARLSGMGLDEISRQLQGALDGSRGGVMLEDLEALPVLVRYEDDARRSLARIETTPLDTSQSETPRWTPAMALGDFSLEPTLGAITRRNGRRVNTVLATLAPDALPISVTRAVQQRIDAGALDLPPDYRVDVGGSAEEQGSAVGLLARYAPVLAALMVGILVLSFGSLRLAGLVGGVALLSAGLGMLSLWAAGFPIGFNPLIGSAGLIGVAINGSIVVLAALEDDPRAREGDLDAIAQVTLASTRHILATTFTTVGGFLPLLLGMQGSFWPPLAVVIAGGVGLSVVLSLVLTPASYALLRRPRRQTATDLRDASPV